MAAVLSFPFVVGLAYHSLLGRLFAPVLNPSILCFTRKQQGRSVFGEHCCRLRNHRPLGLLNIVAVHVNVVAVRVQRPVEHEWGVHEGAGVDKTAVLAHAHLLDVENVAAVEDLEEDGRLSTKDHDLLVCDLMCESHIRGHP